MENRTTELKLLLDAIKELGNKGELKTTVSWRSANVDERCSS